MPDTYVNAERLGYFKGKVDEKIEADLSSKADKTGSYPDLTAGNAAQLIGTVYTEDKEPYKYRTTGGSADVGNRADDTIVGGSLVWNQIVQNGNFADGTNRWSIQNATASASENVLTVTPSGTSNQSVVSQGKNIKAHVYLGVATIKNGALSGTTSLQLRDGDAVRTIATTSAVGAWVSIAGMYKATTANSGGYIRVLFPYLSNIDGVTFMVKKINIFDLTQMFGSTIADYIYSLEQATAGAGVAWFRKLFPDDYYPYNPGEIMSVSGLTSHDMVGFNAFDLSTGTAKVVKDQSYQISGTYTALSLGGETISPDGSGIFTPSQDGTLTVTGGGSDTCIHLQWSGYRNGEYEPYVKHSYPLDSTLTLRGIPKLDANNNLYYDGDIYESDGTVTRKYGIVDLGTLTWLYTSNTHRMYSNGLASKLKTPASSTAVGVAICQKYVIDTDAHTASNYADKTIAIGGSNGMIYVYDSSYTDAETFKAAMSGVYLVYELATTTTETAAPYTNPQIIDDFGTEEYVTDSIVPVGHITKYPENLRDKLQHLPDLASTDGSYLLTQSNKKMSLSPYVAPTIPAFPTPDTTLSVEGGYAEAKTVGDEISGLKEDLLPRETTEQGVDLDITDENGNVIVRFAGGHIQTKEFDSSGITPSPSGSGNVDAYMTDSNADLVLADNFGNVIAQFSEGHIQTKEFDSSNVVQSVNGSVSVLHTLSGIDYTKMFEYNPSAANKQTIVGEFKAGDTILCHFSNAADDVTDICNTRWATYGYVDAVGSEHTLGQERAYNFGRFVLPEDATGIFANFPTELLESGTYTCKFLVYKLGAYERQPHIVTVGADGKRMFTSVRAAMDSFNDNNAYNTYEIWVYPGTYDILADYTDEEIRAEGFKGLWVKNGVTIKGIGHREQIILHGELDPDEYSSTIRNQISTLNMSGNCGLENLTVTNQYNRYAVHDDHMSGFYQEQTRIVENCKFLSWNASSGGIGQAAYGAGGHNNKKLIIRNCDLGDRLIIHNTQLMVVSMTAIVENSTAQQVTLTDNNNAGFTAKTRVEFNNCNFDYVMHDKTSDGTEPTMILCGTGTNNVKLDCEAGTLYNFGDCMKFPATISAGQAVAMSGIRTVVATTSLDNIYGISIGNDGDHTYVQRQGYICDHVLGLTNLSVGDYVTLDSSGIVTASGATQANAIGIVECIAANTETAFIKLLF